MEGFGVRSAEKIRVSIAEHRKHTGRFRIDEVEKLIAGLLEHVASAPGADRVELAGSLRRRRETIGDVDILVQCDGDGTPVVEHFVAFGGAERADAAGPTKGSIVLHSGLQVDLRVVPPDSFGAALVYFTGSKDHNVAMRTRAVRERLRVNEWGVYRVPEGADSETLGKDEGERLSGETEEGVYESLGMHWVYPDTVGT